MVVEFSEEFEKDLKKYCSKAEAKSAVKRLAQTKPTDGDYIALVGNILLKERKNKTFRFYFDQDNKRVRYLSKEDLKNFGF